MLLRVNVLLLRRHHDGRPPPGAHLPPSNSLWRLLEQLAAREGHCHAGKLGARFDVARTLTMQLSHMFRMEIRASVLGEDSDVDGGTRLSSRRTHGRSLLRARARSRARTCTAHRSPARTHPRSLTYVSPTDARSYLIHTARTDPRVQTPATTRQYTSERSERTSHKLVKYTSTETNIC